MISSMEAEILDPIIPQQTDPDEDPIIAPQEGAGTQLERAIKDGHALDDEQMGREAAVAAFGPKALLMDQETAERLAFLRTEARQGMASLPAEPWRLSEEAETMLRWLATPDHVVIFLEGKCHRAIMGQEPDQDEVSQHPLEELRGYFDFVEGQMIGPMLMVEIGHEGRKYLDRVEGKLKGPIVKPAMWCGKCGAYHRGGAAIHN